MSTIRAWLDEAGFDWAAGRIIWHDTGAGGSPGWSEAVGAREVSADDTILRREFDSGYGGPECPRFIAFDAKRIYFPWQYDGATGLETVNRDPDTYLDWEANPTPYPGG